LDTSLLKNEVPRATELPPNPPLQHDEVPGDAAKLSPKLDKEKQPAKLPPTSLADKLKVEAKKDTFISELQAKKDTFISELQSMDYRSLQKLAKDWKIKANSKAKQLIDELVEAFVERELHTY
jgi:2-oxoglutarate dehydrogenase complex dehydrogenase (E1) component-like enzyme